ncbi:MAG: site-specific integrase [bacterium]|nr:site-specific integrase [bacterium]
MRFLSPDEIGHLADAIDPRYRAMVITAGYTGCRFGEIAALDLDHYDPDRRLIHVERSLSEVRGHLRLSEPKTPAARRAITIPAWLPAVADSVGPPMRFHDLRHSHVALLIQQGTHPSVIAARLGHVSVKTVLDVYGHLSVGLDRDAADTLEPPWIESDVDAMWTRRSERRNTGRGLT